jgi:RNA polymerase sigma-70 factor (ECF subfamily)
MEIPEQPVEALIARTALGDRRAFQALYRATAPRLFGVALLIAKRRDWAEDAMQEAFLALWRRAGDFKPERGSGLGWMATIVRNRAIDRVRREPKFAGEADREAPDPAPDALAALVQSDEARRIARCLGELDEAPRRAIALAFYVGLSHTELAARLDAPLGTVKSWIRRGLARLRHCFEQTEDRG